MTQTVTASNINLLNIIEMKVFIDESVKFKNLKKKFIYVKATPLIKYLINTYEDILNENNKLSNENMILSFKLEMLKKEKSDILK